jgi:hypothetical protein
MNYSSRFLRCSHSLLQTRSRLCPQNDLQDSISNNRKLIIGYLTEIAVTPRVLFCNATIVTCASHQQITNGRTISSPTLELRTLSSFNPVTSIMRTLQACGRDETDNAVVTISHSGNLGIGYFQCGGRDGGDGIPLEAFLGAWIFHSAAREK